jgi:hypothetical protein
MELAQNSRGFRALSIVAAVVITVAMAAPLAVAAAKIIL